MRLFETRVGFARELTVATALTRHTCGIRPIELTELCVHKRRLRVTIRILAAIELAVLVSPVTAYALVGCFFIVFHAIEISANTAYAPARPEAYAGLVSIIPVTMLAKVNGISHVG
jgi:hypothetical protein